MEKLSDFLWVCVCTGSNRVNEHINLNLNILELFYGLVVQNRRKLHEDVEILSSKFSHFAYFNIA